MANEIARPRIRRRWKVLGIALVLCVIGFAALPVLLQTNIARARIGRAINKAFAPGTIRFEAIELGWFSPTRLSKVVLLDPHDKVVARVPVASLDKTLSNLILGNHSPVVLSLEKTELEVQRSESGRIDLAEALKTIVANPDPTRDLTIRIERGTLEYRDPVLAEPSMADSVDLTLRIPPAPNPVTWNLNLASGKKTLEIQGDFDRWLSNGGLPKTPELQVGVVGRNWPFVAKVAEIKASGRFDGSIDFSRRRGKWVLTGDTRFQDFKADGDTLAGDTLAIDTLDAGWDLAEADSGWTIRRLGFDSPIAHLKADGKLSGPGATGHQKIVGQIDLAAIARQLPRALRLREGLAVERGSAGLTLDLNSTREGSTYDVEARVSDLLAKDHGRVLTLRDPAVLGGRFVRKGNDSSVERLALKTSFLDASASGRLEDGVVIDATLDLAGLRKQLLEWVDLGAIELAGTSRVTGNFRFWPVGQVHERASKPSPGFQQSLVADFRDLRVDGLGIGSIRRDNAELRLSIDGPADASGVPTGWDKAMAKVRSPGSSLDIDLESRRETIAMKVSGWTGLGSKPNADHWLSAKLDGQWSLSGELLTIDRAGLAIIKPDPKRPRALIEASARGTYRHSTGELALESVPGDSGQFIAPGQDGLRISGLGQGMAALRVEGGFTGLMEPLDLLVSDVSARPPLGLTGRWTAIASVKGQGEDVQMAARVGLVESRRDNVRSARPTAMSINARYSPRLDRVELAEFAVSMAYGVLDASGRLDDPLGDRRIQLVGKLSPDFEAITAFLVDKVEPGSKIDGRPREFKASGAVGEGWKGLEAEFGFDLLGADIYGMKFGASPVVLRTKGGRLSFDPISTSINEGHIRLEPEIDLEGEGGPVLRLAKNSNIREARINDEVSKRVLAYVAPVLDQATRASGLVSVDLDHAEFPLGAGRGRQAKVEGAVVFQDVEFAPGPLAAEILGAIGRRDLSLKLDQPVTLTIADGRINQRGMSIPVGDLTRIELSGWVDFDRKLGLVASVPVTASMLGNNPLLSEIASGTKVRLPISGTLDKPEIDREAFSNNLQELGKTLLTRGATRGALELLMRLGRSRDPEAPPAAPRMTPEERKAQRLEKKAIRKGEIAPPR